MLVASLVASAIALSSLALLSLPGQVLDPGHSPGLLHLLLLHLGLSFPSLTCQNYTKLLQCTCSLHQTLGSLAHLMAALHTHL